MEVAWVSMGWMDKENVVYAYNGMLLSQKRMASCHLQQPEWI